MVGDRNSSFEPPLDNDETLTVQVNEIAKKAGVSSELVRYYSRLGLLTPSVNSDNRYRQFTEMDLSRLKFILRAKGLGFKLSEISEIIKTTHRRKTPCPMVRDIVAKRIIENRIDLESLIRLQRRMERALSKWKRMSDGVPDGNEICRLIESID